MEKILPIVLVLLVFTATGCSDPIIKPIPKDTAWCVKMCIDDMFEPMHSNPTTKGASSSSLPMYSSDTFDKVKNYCERIYKDGCYQVDSRSDLRIHGNWPYCSSSKNN